MQCNSVSPGDRQAVPLRVATRDKISEWVDHWGVGGIVTWSIFPTVQRIPGGRGSRGIGLHGGRVTADVYRCNGGSHSIETVDAWSTHSIAHGLETKVQMLNLEKGEGDSCHVITIFQQPYNIVSSLISLLEVLLWFEAWGKHSKSVQRFFPFSSVRESLGMTEQQAAVWLNKCS